MTKKTIAALACLAVLPAFSEDVSLSKDLMPLFDRSCADCHNPDSKNKRAIEDKTYFLTKDDLLGKVGTAIKAGNPEESGLIKVLDQTAKFGKRGIPMPPPRSGIAKFSKKEIEMVSAWIKAGAKDN